MTAARDFAGSYAPGGLTKRALARRNGRRGGLASGIKRRQLARGHRPRPNSRAEALALAYRHQQLSRARFERRYEQTFPQPERPSAAVAWEKGRETLWQHYCATFTLYRMAGQHCRTTNGQRGSALAARGHERVRRTLIRLNHKLEAMGLCKLSHYRAGGAAAGRRDCLVLEVRTPTTISHVTPPLRGRGNRPFGSEVPPSTATSKTLIPPPSAAETDWAAAPPGTERDGLEASIAFLQLKLDAGWDCPRLRLDLRQLRAQLRAIPDPGDARSHEQG